MPKGNGDSALVLYLIAFLSRQEHGECRKAMETYNVTGKLCVISCQEHGECRKAMETRPHGHLLNTPPTRQEHGECRKAMETGNVRAALLDAERRQEHGECRKAMETRRRRRRGRWGDRVRNTVNAERQWRRC